MRWEAIVMRKSWSRDLDMDLIRQARNSWHLYRDRQPECYAAITKPLSSYVP
jgi:hypothetical protein